MNGRPPYNIREIPVQALHVPILKANENRMFIDDGCSSPGQDRVRLLRTLDGQCSNEQVAPVYERAM